MSKTKEASQSFIMTNNAYGFIYAGQSEPSPLHQANTGQRIAIDDEFTAFPVHYEIATIAINEWPGNLWFVEAIKGTEYQAATEDTDYFHTQSLKILKKLPNSLLFGPKGENICYLLDKITTLTLPQIEKLALLATPMGEIAYTEAWNNWLTESNNHAMHADADHIGTLAIGVGEDTSPIYSGFLTINDLLHKRAQQLEGETAFIIQQGYGYDKPEIFLNSLWSQACRVLLQTAMGLGAAQYVSPQNLQLLLSGWELLAKD